MSKGLDALKDIKSRLYIESETQTKIINKDLSIIEKELKALEIMIEKEITPSWFIRNLKKGMTYEDYHFSNSGSPYDMTQKIDLLKEVLL